MFLARPERTPYDLSWRMFGIPIRVHPFFWVFTAIIGWHHVRDGLQFLIIWIASVFISILLHELGHIWMGRLFGSRGEIVLYSFGGLAIGSKQLRKRWQRIAVSAAGPGIQLLLWGALVGIVYLTPLPKNVYVVELYDMLIWINLYWAIFNLIPIWPLDGGQISREIWEGISKRRGTKIALQLSIALALIIALNAGYAVMPNGKRVIPFLPVGIYIAILFGMLMLTNVQALQAENERNRWREDRAYYDENDW